MLQNSTSVTNSPKNDKSSFLSWSYWTGRDQSETKTNTKNQGVPGTKSVNNPSRKGHGSNNKRAIMPAPGPGFNLKDHKTPFSKLAAEGKFCGTPSDFRDGAKGQGTNGGADDEGGSGAGVDCDERNESEVDESKDQTMKSSGSTKEIDEQKDDHHGNNDSQASSSSSGSNYDQSPTQPASQTAEDNNVGTKSGKSMNMKKAIIYYGEKSEEKKFLNDEKKNYGTRDLPRPTEQQVEPSNESCGGSCMKYFLFTTIIVILVLISGSWVSGYSLVQTAKSEVVHPQTHLSSSKSKSDSDVQLSKTQSKNSLNSATAAVPTADTNTKSKPESGTKSDSGSKDQENQAKKPETEKKGPPVGIKEQGGGLGLEGGKSKSASSISSGDDDNRARASTVPGTDHSKSLSGRMSEEVKDKDGQQTDPLQNPSVTSVGVSDGGKGTKNSMGSEGTESVAEKHKKEVSDSASESDSNAATSSKIKTVVDSSGATSSETATYPETSASSETSTSSETAHYSEISTSSETATSTETVSSTKIKPSPKSMTSPKPVEPSNPFRSTSESHIPVTVPPPEGPPESNSSNSSDDSNSRLSKSHLSKLRRSKQRPDTSPAGSYYPEEDESLVKREDFDSVIEFCREKKRRRALAEKRKEKERNSHNRNTGCGDSGCDSEGDGRASSFLETTPDSSTGTEITKSTTEKKPVPEHKNLPIGHPDLSFAENCDRLGGSADEGYKFGSGGYNIGSKAVAKTDPTKLWLN